MHNMWRVVGGLVCGTSLGCGDDGPPPGPPASVDTIPPAVVALIPQPDETGVALDATIEITFSEPVNPATVAAASFILQSQTSTLVAGTRQVSGTTAIFRPDSMLDSLTVYTATVTRAVRDSAGNGLRADTSWAFLTGSPPPPAAGVAPACGGPGCRAP